MNYAEVAGGIAAYKIMKFELERSEIYIFDPAVTAAQRREDISAELIAALKNIAVTRDAYAILFKQILALMTQQPSRFTLSLEHVRMSNFDIALHRSDTTLD